MDVDYIIVQAGGKGTRMRELTYNKPKALVPVDNLPMLFHLFRRFEKKRFLIIGDYKYEVLERYLRAFAPVDYELIDARGMQGTCAGIGAALQRIPKESPFLLIWSDLVLPPEYTLPEKPGNYVGLSGDFPCRWRYENGKFEEESSTVKGVAGYFIFTGKSVLAGVPREGEFVRWLGGQKIAFEIQSLYRTREYGLLSEYRKLKPGKCRPFNRIREEDGCLVKEPLDEQGRRLAVRETAWYEKIKQYGFRNIPEIYGVNPLRMEKIRGKNIYELTLDREGRERVLKRLVECLREIHGMESCPAEEKSYYEAYIGKTFRRLETVRDLVPFAREKMVRINGEDCPNIFFVRDEVEKRIMSYMPREFRLLHGDCTFSNMMLREDGEPVMIDPRGYFGFTEFYGDPAYDWVKLYYSLAGNYDRFNLKLFTLRIEETEVFLQTDSNGWEDMEGLFFSLLGDEVTAGQMRLLHAVTWLSLTTYAWEDYDSICGAFYDGLLILKDALEKGM